ncbi:DNA-binding response regulator [candidate division KSB1 bacterium 4572_119]|nr:MAG: DNA-binding response regulator [candidate division KSB1 bacterium 4572_119]
MIRVLIADDHEIVRKGLKQIISDTLGIEVTDEASNGQEALDKIKQTNFDVVLLDIKMPGRTGLDILKDIKQFNPNLAVLILTIYPEEQYAIRVLQSGASGYLTKDSAANELILAIQKVASGGKYVSASLAEKLAFYLDTDKEKEAHELLSAREYQVLLQLAQGVTIKEISNNLNLSSKTISTYRSRILEKLNLKNTAEIIHYAIKHKLVE